jgi:peptidoglycan/xylan/chitin deacetylase (PgdA/CDA1 family)
MGSLGTARTLALLLCLFTAAVAAAPARAATTVSLTFDDGQATQYAVKAPLASRGMHGTFYLNSGKVGTSDFYMSWTQASALASDGNEIGGHTLSHANISGTGLTDAQKRAEVCNDRQNLVARGFNPVSFAYPFGSSDAAAQAIVRDCGYISGRRVGGVVSPNWCPQCGTPRAESIPPLNAFDTRTPSFGSGELTLSAMQNVVTQAELSGGGWVQFVFHGVCESGGCGEGWVKPSTFSALLDWLAPRAGHGTVVRTVRQVMESAPPDTSIGSKPPAVTPDRSATFTLASNKAGSTFECSLDSGAWTACTSPVTYSNLAVGGHSFRARAKDQFGAVDPTPATWTWTIESSPGAGAPTVVSLTFDDGDKTQYAAAKEPLKAHGMHGTFYLNSAQVCTSNCGGEWNMSWAQVEALAADGNEIGGHTLEHVDLTSNAISAAEKRRQICEDHDNLAARGFDPVSFAYPFGHSDGASESLVEECGYASGRDAGDAPAGGETIPPLDPYRVRTPDQPSGELTLAFLQSVVTQSENAGGGWLQLTFHGMCETAAGCGEGWVKPATFAALLDWLEPRETDGTVVQTVREVMGKTPPETSIGSGPTGTVASTSASFAFSSSESGSTFECKLDSGAWAGCASPKAYSGLAQGAHTFSVRATDAAGNADATPASRTWTVDTVAPSTTLGSTGPSGTVASASASFEFSSADATATFECQLDSGAWGACASPKSYSGLGQGSHTFSVRAKDPVGNTDATPASRTWTVDTVAPSTSISDGPSGTVASGSASFQFSSADGTATFECQLDAGAWAPCASPKSYSGLGQGQHTFSVRAKDAVGNVDATPASRTWTVDTVAPSTSISDGPSGTVASTSASLQFSSADGTATFECQLDSGGWAACVSPKSYSGLGQGQHTFSVRAKDPAGNTDATPASHTWTVDTLAPGVSITSAPPATAETASASFEFSSPDPGATFECRLDAAAWGGCTSPTAYSGLADGSHTFDVRATDALGNVDATPASHTWTVAVPPPPAPPTEPEEPPTPQEEPPAEPETPPAGETPPPGEERPPAGSEQPPPEEGEETPPPSTNWEAYVADVLREAARANRGKRLKRLLRRGWLAVPLSRSDLGTLRVKVALLPYPPAPSVRLARGKAEPADALRALRLKLNKRGKRRLARLYVAAIELEVTFEPADGGEAVFDRTVFKVRR